MNICHRFYVLAYALIAIVMLAIVSQRCEADTLVLTNGRQFEGRLVSQDDRVITFEIHQVGVRMTIRRPASEVKQVIREVSEGPTYCVLPIVGTIGRDLEADSYITADSFIQALNEVRAAKPDYVILNIKSPGGDIAEMDRIISAIAGAKELKFIAYIEDAHSAAAVIAMACPHIFMAPNSSIGAAVPFSVGPDGTPQNVQEKWLSAIRAGFRNAAKLGGHSPLILRGMSETEIELAVVQLEGRPAVIEPAADDMGHIIKPKGQILTLTADEALVCGLSEATVSSNAVIHEYLGLDSWQPILPNVWDYIIGKSQSEKRQIAIAREQAERRAAKAAALRQQQAERQAHIDRIAPTLLHIETRLAELDAQAQAASQAEQELAAQQYQLLAALDAEYRQLRSEAYRSADPAGELRRLDAEYERQRSLIIGDYQQRATDARERHNKAVLEAEQLRRQHQELVNSVPRY